MYWQVPVALVLTSVKWWENFVDKTSFANRLFSIKKDIQRVRTKMAVLTSLWAIFFTLGFVYFLEYMQVTCSPYLFSNFKLFIHNEDRMVL